ncbi:unnamed protein product [Cuscuta epithymum]|uniref:Uncharacterized protein n=1 Tax=Cuscuta epithymum TaxID=186058 RepID=A0AAV0D7C9_9ASTE|nr:unnamed protein product [Cuscuta epithymum]
MEIIQETGSLEKYIVGSVPTLIYIPNFISDIEEEQLVKNIYGAPVSKWKSLKNRRLQNWGGVVHEKGLIAQDCTSCLFIPFFCFYEIHLFYDLIHFQKDPWISMLF